MLFCRKFYKFYDPSPIFGTTVHFKKALGQNKPLASLTCRKQYGGKVEKIRRVWTQITDFSNVQGSQNLTLNFDAAQTVDITDKIMDPKGGLESAYYLCMHIANNNN